VPKGDSYPELALSYTSGFEDKFHMNIF